MDPTPLQLSGQALGHAWSGKFAISFWFVGAEGRIDEERVVQLCHFLRIRCHIGLPDALPGLEWHVENEPLKKQLSGPDFYDLDFGRW